MNRPAAEQHNAPGFAFARDVFNLILYFLLGPAIVWLVLVFVVPFVCGLAKKGDAYIDYLHRVEGIEQRTAVLMAPEVKLGDTVLLTEGWTYKIGRNIAMTLIPDGRKGYFVDQQAEHETATTVRENNMAHSQGLQSTPESGGQKGILAHLGSYFDDRFFPVNRTWIATAITRLFFMAEMAIIILPWLVVGWMVGAYRVRKKDESGEQHLGNRFRAWYLLAINMVGLMPLLVVLPLPVPGIVIAAMTLLPLPFVVMKARSHYVTRL